MARIGEAATYAYDDVKLSFEFRGDSVVVAFLEFWLRLQANAVSSILMRSTAATLFSEKKRAAQAKDQRDGDL